jgi:hypothetical protein
MRFDRWDVYRFRDAGLLIQIAHVAGQRWIVCDTPYVAFKMPDIHGVKAYERRKQTPICLCDLVAY